jgi:hypothetical protein
VNQVNTGHHLEQLARHVIYAAAVTTATRSEALPNTAAVSEFVPDYEASDWFGLGAPKHVSPRSSRISIGPSA